MCYEKQHHISLKEFSAADNSKTSVKRYSRIAYLKLPKVDFYQFRINYDTVTVEKAKPKQAIEKSADSARVGRGVIKTTDLSMDASKTNITFDDAEYGKKPITFNIWVYEIMKGGFGDPSIAELMQNEKVLKNIYHKITYEKNESRYYSSKYDRHAVASNIRKAFRDKLDFKTTEELIPEKASLLNIANFSTEVHTDRPQDYYPEKTVVENIIKDDKGKLKLDSKMEDTIRFLEQSGNQAMAETLRVQNSSHKNKDRSFHYLPYRTDSCFEQTFLKEVLSFDEIEKLGLEVYYNGDCAMTEFKIKCYRQNGGKWRYVGIYTPDFLIIKRKKGTIHKIIIVETKGEIYANDSVFKDKKNFMATEFSKQNNAAYGYERFDYLYLEDTLSEKDRLTLTHKKINEFFKEI